jgi:hypothetical protein
VDDPSEYLDPANDSGAGYTNGPQTRVYRWYEIQKLEERPDGTKRIYVERTRWNSVNGVAPKLYDFDNYTWSNHDRPLKYIIAPGAYVADISRAWTNSSYSEGQVSPDSPRTLKLAPGGDVGTRFDFEKGDPIIQAIGQDPWNPTGMRIRHHNYVPSTIEDSSIQAVNYGRVTVDSGLSIGGGSMELATDVKNSKDKNPLFLKGVEIGASTGVGVFFRGDVRDAAILFEQPHNRAQPLVWRVQGQTTHSLVVDPQKGGFQFNGGGINLQRGGISGGDKAANNLRGISLPVPVQGKQLKVTFAKPEADADYAIIVQSTWMTLDAISEKTATGFTVNFGTEAPADAHIDWMLLR